MATIRKREGKKGTSYQVIIRLGAGGQDYTERETFATHKEAKAWAAARESQLLRNGVPAKEKGEAPENLASALNRYRLELEASPKGIGRSKKSNLKKMEKMPEIAALPFMDLRSQQLVGFITELMAPKMLPDGQVVSMSPATANEYLGNIRTLYDHADLAWSLGDVPLGEVEKAGKHCRQLGLVAKPGRRSFRPTLEQIDAVMGYWERERSGKAAGSKTQMPMLLIILFAIFSTRRLGEICRIEWDDLDEENNSILIRAMKHPDRAKKAENDVWVTLTPRAMAIIKLMPRVAARIFPYNPKSVGNAFTRAKQWAGMPKEFEFHCFRHEGASHYFEIGQTIEKVALVTGHQDWSSLRIYTHMRFAKNFDKFEGWHRLKQFGLDKLPTWIE